MTATITRIRNRFMGKRAIRMSNALRAEILKGFRYARFHSHEGERPNTIILEWWGATYILEMTLYRKDDGENALIRKYQETFTGGTIGVGMNPLHSEADHND